MSTQRIRAGAIPAGKICNEPQPLCFTKGKSMSIATESRLSRWRRALDEADPILGEVEPIQISSCGRRDLDMKVLLRFEDFRRLFAGREVTKETNRHGIFFYCQVGAVLFEANTEHVPEQDQTETITLE
jgi:hypothetical protein